MIQINATLKIGMIFAAISGILRNKAKPIVKSGRKADRISWEDSSLVAKQYVFKWLEEK